MNTAWKQVREASKVALNPGGTKNHLFPDVNRKTLRSRLRSEPELAVARKGVFGTRVRGFPHRFVAASERRLQGVRAFNEHGEHGAKHFDVPFTPKPEVTWDDDAWRKR